VDERDRHAPFADTRCDPNDGHFQVSYRVGVGFDYSNPYAGVGVLHNNLDGGGVPGSLRQAVAMYESAFGGVPKATLAQYEISAPTTGGGTGSTGGGTGGGTGDPGGTGGSSGHDLYA
jgi:hypothetical protein